jgi:predicted ATPase/class 3 adenylate cyclase/ribosomal protein L40E
MRCRSCSYDNPADALFCMKCGAKVEYRCPSCNTVNPADANFCRKCGRARESGAADVSSSSTLAPKTSHIEFSQGRQTTEELEGERKTVTALFADIKGSTELMEDLDPEEARAIIDPALRIMVDAVRRYEGYVVQLTGDGIFALFGAPVAHEDHPQRALYAALRMQEELRGYGGRLQTEGRAPVEIRVGVNTGEVVVRSIATGATQGEYTPIGHTTNLASRLQSIARTGSIVASEATRKLCEGYFILKPLGATRVKGVSEPVNVYEVTGLGPLRTRLQGAVGRGLTRFVGRQAELAQMRLALELVRDGHGQIVAAMGDPGVGKSRLFFEFKAVAQSGCVVLEAYSVSHGKASAYLPVIDLLKTYFKIAAEDDERARREKVAGKVVMLDRTFENTLPYLFGLLGIVEGEDPLARIDPQLRRRRTLEAIKRILVRESLSQPLIVEFEDLHWIDSETQALLNLIVDSLATTRILLLVNYRPEYHHQWGSKTYYSQLRLDPLSKESADEMLDSLLGSGPLPDQGEGRGVDIAPLKRLIIERTEGNPFFMEEMVQALFEQGVFARNGAVKLAKPLEQIRVPPTVQAILASRIDRLPAAQKELLQTLAVLGREFSLGLIKRVTGKPEDELEALLSELQLAEFIYEQRAVPDIEYTFKHALTQEVAYNSVLVERRKLLHERAGEAVETLFAGQLDEHLTELARHYSHSPNLGKAIKYLHQAGQQAAQRSAYTEAVGHLSSALELLNRLPDDREHSRRELELQFAIAESLRWAKGGGSEETERALIRARELCGQVGGKAELFAVLQGLHVHYTARMLDLNTARDLGEQLLTLAEGADDPANLMVAHGALGLSFLLTGEFPAARKHLEQASPRFDWNRSRTFGMFYPSFCAWALWAVGYGDQALKWSREALASAEALSRPAFLANALVQNASLHTFLRDARMARERAEAAIAISTEYGLPLELAYGTFVRGWALAQQDHPEEGVAEMRRAAITLKAMGFMRPRFFAYIGEACAGTEGPATGLKVLAEGGAMMERTGERIYEAEMDRLKGEFLLMHDTANTLKAEHCFRTAIEVSRHQGGKALALRATVSLARLFATLGRRDEARTMLAEIYAWFTEGFDTADLKEARALLDELSY